MDYTKVSEEVFYNIATTVVVSKKDIGLLKEQAALTLRKRARLCTHGTPEDSLHEMLIVHPRDAYVHPHKHLQKSESFHIVEGEADAVLFEEDGTIAEVIRMGDYASGKNFFYRIPASRFHTLIIRSDILVFHETTNGPFRREETVFADWAPFEADAAAVEAYMGRLSTSLVSLY